MFSGSPAEIAWPHGEAGLATIAPGNVLSSDGLEHVGAQVVLVGERVAVEPVEPGSFFGGVLERQSS